MMSYRKVIFKGCYRQIQQTWTVRALTADGGYETLLVELSDDDTVEDALLKVLQDLGIPQVALPAVCLCRRRSCDFKKRPKTEFGSSAFVNTRPRGLPFFRPVSAFRRPPRRLYLRVDVDLLPRSEAGVQHMLGERGMELLAHQVLAEVMLARLSDWKPIDWVFGGLRFLQQRTDDSSFNSFRNEYLIAMNRNLFPPPTRLMRRVMSFEQIFKKSVIERYEAQKDMNDFGHFFENVAALNPQVHPLRLIKQFGSEMDPFDYDAFLCQLERLSWKRRTLTVTYCRDFAGEEVTKSCKSFSATDFSFLVRYLSLHHPAVVCEKSEKSATVRMETRLQNFCRCHDVCPQMPVGNDGCCQRRYHFTGFLDGKLQLLCDTDTLTTDLSSIASTATQPTRSPVADDVAGLVGLKIQLGVEATTNPLLDRMPGVESSDKVFGKGRNSEVSKGRLVTDGGEEELFAVKRLRTERIPALGKSQAPPPVSQRLAAASSSAVDLDNLRLLTASACRAVDHHRPPWPLLPVRGLRPDQALVLTPWVRAGSLHDLLAKPSERRVKARHLLQTAVQLSAALVYLEQLKVTEVGLHPRNVLVLEHSDASLHVCLTEAGTRSVQRQECWQRWRRELFPDSHTNNDERDLHISLRLAALYGRCARLEDEGDAAELPGRLWRHRCVLNAAGLLVWARRALQREPTEELDRDVSAPCTKLELIPKVMQLETDSSTSLCLGRDGVMLGKGFFGEVWKNNFLTTNNTIIPVAVKHLKPNSGDIMQEVKIHKNMDHKNVIRLIEFDAQNNLIVMAFADNGTLLEYVRKRCKEMPDPELEQIGRRFCREICEGMIYLHERSPPVIHRDLALRNILLDTPDLVVKISDFGLSRFLKDDIYEPSPNTKLPVCWLPPSDIRSGKMDAKVDVWSFGVCMWEIFTRGRNPVKFYEEHIKPLQVDGLYEKVFYYDLYLPKDNIIPEMYDIMRNRCWIKEAARRPSFSDLLSEFAG